MQSLQIMDCDQTSEIKLERVNFFNRQLLTAGDMTTDRDYFLQKLRRHNRFMHGWGVVCGLPVTAAPVQGAAWRVEIGPGYALGPCGDEIFVGEAVYFDLAACLSGGATNPCEPTMIIPGGAGTGATAYLAIRYAECLARPVQVAYSGCGCDDDPCQYSRIRDSFQIQCLAQMPDQPAPTVTLCQIVNGEALAPCPPCPTDPWVIIAKIELPSARTTNIADSNIDNKIRRVILSTAVLQDQIVRCCCKQQPTVDLQSIQARPSGTNDWPDSPVEIKLTDTSWDYLLTLTGPAPPGGFIVNVTATDVETRNPSRYTTAQTPATIPPGQTFVVISPNAVTSHPNQSNVNEEVTITATAESTGTSRITTLLLLAPHIA